MTNLSNKKGQSFEAEVEEILRRVVMKFPSRVRLFVQPRIPLENDQTLIPDFDLRYDLPMGESAHWIELQDRKRSSPQIAQKIKYAKMLTNRNRFIFVYRHSIPAITRKALKDDGVICVSLPEFARYISGLEATLALTINLPKSEISISNF